MGYCGIGYNKWIKDQRPRKFLTRQRKPFHTSVESQLGISTGNRSFNISGKRTKPNRYVTFTVKLLIGLLLVGIIGATYAQWNNYVIEYNKPTPVEFPYKKMSDKEFSLLIAKDYHERGYYEYANDNLEVLHLNDPKNMPLHKLYVLNRLKLCEIGIDCNKTKIEFEQFTTQYPKEIL